MMDFNWDEIDNDEEIGATTYEGEGGEFLPIPNNTIVKAYIEEAKWTPHRDNEDAKFIAFKWKILEPELFRNRVIPQKLWVHGNNPEHKNPEDQGAKHTKLFFAVDANCGGKIKKARKTPNDSQLQQCVSNKPMNITLMQWKIQGDNGPIEGNWVRSVAPAGDVPEPDAAKIKAQASKAKEAAVDLFGGDDSDPIPF